ncbi:MAG TPA: DUF692 domain-containing protein [Usitatibacter sp.]|nr:DUF692 domain-containing protein [Usitatibacter sp.]
MRGFGLGLRPEHHREFASGGPRVDWLEILTENYLVPGGKPLDFLDRIRGHYAMSMHGVSLSVAGTDPLDEDYLAAVAALARRVEPAWISDHLCWTGVDGTCLHDLLPVPLTREALAHVAGRVQRVQERLRRPLVLENVSSYVRHAGEEMEEWEFLAELSAATGCELLLDVNNVYVNSVNHGFDPRAFLDALAPRAVRQVHLAGHTDNGDHLIDTHDAPVCEAVWDLYEHSVARFGAVPAMIERDDRIPPLAELLAELDIARERAARASARGGMRALAA